MEAQKKFEYESCSKFKILQLSFQAHFHLKLRLKVKNSNSNAKENYPKHIVFRIFLQLLCGNLKNFEHESCLLYETLQLLFWAKIKLSYGLHFVFSDLFSIFRN